MNPNYKLWGTGLALFIFGVITVLAGMPGLGYLPFLGGMIILVFWALT
jgi:hypothetical protein